MDIVTTQSSEGQDLAVSCRPGKLHSSVWVCSDPNVQYSSIYHWLCDFNQGLEKINL